MFWLVEEIHQRTQAHRHHQPDDDRPRQNEPLLAAIRRAALAGQQVKSLRFFVALEIEQLHLAGEFSKNAAAIQAARLR